jgi:hypothetical protein
MTQDPDQPTTGTQDVEEAVTVVCGHSWSDARDDRYVFAFHIPAAEAGSACTTTAPARDRLGHTYRLTLTPTPRCEHRPAQQPDPAADAA